MATAPVPTRPPVSPAGREILIVSHSSLFYWWPVWAVGFLLAIISLFSHYVIAVVPAGTYAEKAVDLEKRVAEGPRDVLITPKDRPHLFPDPSNPEKLESPKLHISASKNPGVLFMTVLLLVVFITNVPLRGLWSVIVIVFIISLSIIFALLDWWTWIMTHLSFLDIRINAAGYLAFSLVLFIMWVVIFVFFDKQIYMVFTPGQLRVRLEIGDAETAYDTAGMTIQKQRSDVFRHWILGLGSGDLIVRTSGAQAHTFDMPNVLFLGRKVKDIEEMLRAKEVVSGQR